MKQNLTFWEILPVGLMLFSSFFGAGNLIFPPALGQAAGDHFWSAAIGFCVTGVGMPLLGIIAMALTKNDNPNALADPVHPNFAKIIVMLAVLTIGPLFAIPRTGAVSYDVGIRPFVPEDYYTAGLAIYSLFFFIVTYVLSINPSKLVDWLGKVLTPMLLLSLAVLIINVLLAPMGPMQPATGSYINHLVEITRKKARQNLSTVLYAPCPICQGGGRVQSRETVALEIKRRLRTLLAKPCASRSILISANPWMVEWLRAKDLRQWERELACKIKVEADTGLHIETFSILDNTGVDK